jgi:hypothetical protein
MGCVVPWLTDRRQGHAIEETKYGHLTFHDLLVAVFVEVLQTAGIAVEDLRPTAEEATP